MRSFVRLRPLALLLAAAAPASAQVIETGSGSVEFVGLGSWSAASLADSIAQVAPDVPLNSAACAEVLRDLLGFPDAGVLRFRDGRTVILVVEPADSQRVRLRAAPMHGLPVPESWSDLTALRRADPVAFSMAASTVLRRALGDFEITEMLGADSLAAATAWRALDALRTRQQRDLALRLVRDGVEEARVIAAYMLGLFPAHDGAWHGLVAALRDTSWTVRSAAHSSLIAFRMAAPRVVDWEPARDDLAALMDGTTIVFHTDVLRILTATRIEPDLGRDLLRSSGRLVLDEVGAHHEYVRDHAHAFLVHVAGADLGFEPERWAEWIAASLR